MGSTILRLPIYINEFAKLKIRLVIINRISICPDNLRLVKSMGMWRIKKRMLAMKVELKVFFDSIYKVLKTNPRDTISSDIAVTSIMGIKEINRVRSAGIKKGRVLVLMKVEMSETIKKSSPTIIA